jgi:hypothetical protein
MQLPRFLYRRDAAEYLLTKHGVDVSAEHLARLAVAGGGPRSDHPAHQCRPRKGEAAYLRVNQLPLCRIGGVGYIF